MNIPDIPSSLASFIPEGGFVRPDPDPASSIWEQAFADQMGAA